MRKTSNVGTTRYVWDGDDLALELDWAGNLLREYAYYPGVDQPHSVRRASDGAVFRYTQEVPGHVSGLVAAGNQVVNTYTYTPFGESLTTSEQVEQPLRYASREYDEETGLYYVRSRYYDPQQGRFVSEDPIGLAGGINPYLYAGNDPINLTDPTGEAPNTCKSDKEELRPVEVEDKYGKVHTIMVCVLKGAGDMVTGLIGTAQRGVKKLWNSGWSGTDLVMTLYTGVWYFVPAKHTAGAANEFVDEYFPTADPRVRNNALHLFGSCFLTQTYGKPYALWITTSHESFFLPHNREREYRPGSDTSFDLRNNAIGITLGSQGADCRSVAIAHAYMP